MAKGFKAGASGVALNYKVIGGTTEPGNPKENTIWLNTDKKITGHYFSATEPEKMAEGEVWISTGTSSPASFNALEKNTITVYPLRAKQMVSGALVDVKAKSWQNGEWVEWYTFLLKDGNDFKDITGGWTGYAASCIEYVAAPTVEFVDGALRIYNSVGTKTAGIGGTVNMIDLTNVKTVHFLVESVAINTKAYIGVWTISEPSATFVAGAQDVTAGGEILVDVSGLSGSYYVGALVGRNVADGLGEIYISDIYWE